MTSRFAGPFSGESGRPRRIFGQRGVGVHLAFDFEVRRRAHDRASASRIFRADGVSGLPKLECESSATFGFDAEASAPPRRPAG